MQNTSILTKIRDNKDRTRLPDKSVQTYIDVDEVRKLLKIEGGGSGGGDSKSEIIDLELRDISKNAYVQEPEPTTSDKTRRFVIESGETIGSPDDQFKLYRRGTDKAISYHELADLIVAGAPLRFWGVMPGVNALESRYAGMRLSCAVEPTGRLVLSEENTYTLQGSGVDPTRMKADATLYNWALSLIITGEGEDNYIFGFSWVLPE